MSREKGNIFLFNTVNGQLLVTNSTGFNIFNLCNGANTEEIMNTLIAQYSADTKNSLRKECLYFLKEAKRLNLISIKLGGKNEEKEKTKKMEKA